MFEVSSSIQAAIHREMFVNVVAGSSLIEADKGLKLEDSYLTFLLF